MPTTSQCLRGVAVALVLLGTACGASDGATVTGGDDPVGTPDGLAEVQQVTTDGDPRDLVSFTNATDAVTLVNFDSYEQLRDYADLSVVATVQDVTIARAFEAGDLLPGELRVEVRVDAVLGGRMTDVHVGDAVTFLLPLDAPTELVETYRDRLSALHGLRFALFLVQVVDGDADRRFTPILDNAPPAILAEWPDDGRLAPVEPHDYLARGAIERGVERTGVPYDGEPDWAPRYDGDAPIGMTVAEAAEAFAGTPGRPATGPPAGWDVAEPLLAPAT